MSKDLQQEHVLKEYKKKSEAILFKMYQLLERAHTKTENATYRETLAKLQKEL